MSKLAAALGVVVLGSGATLTGGYMLGGFGYDYELPQKLEDEKDGFTKLGHQEGCVQNLFPGIDNLNQTTNIVSEDFSSSFFESGKTKKGCLVVNGDKWKGNDTTKTQGNFRFLWAMQSEKKGFIVFATADTTTEKKGSSMRPLT